MLEKTTLKKSDIFISYGRAESKVFAKRLHDHLKEAGLEVWFDQNDIPLAIDFQEQIDEGINKADNFVFIIAPHALKSPYCLKEIQLAIKYCKRIIPILHIEPKEKAVWDLMHPVISKLNWLYFREKQDDTLPLDQWQALDNLETSFAKLMEIVNTNRDYVDKHTDLLIRALEWESNQRNIKYLLFDKARIDAEKWLGTTFERSLPPCEPSSFHCEYICESKKAANEMMSDIFICSTMETEDVREKIRRSLMRYGITSWNSQTDIGTSAKVKHASNRGILLADNFLFFITPYTVNSNRSLEELDLALLYRKRIIPILVQQTVVRDIPPKLRTINTINLLNQEEEHYRKAIDSLLHQINEDKTYHNQHKVLLNLALKWEKQKQMPSFLLKGYQLDNAKTWLKLGKNKYYRPTELHEKFITASDEQPKQQVTDVFIAYSRSDSDFAHHLNNQLQISGKITWFDQENMPSAADFRQAIFRGIDKTNNILFIISPDSIKSAYCKEEIEYAIGLNKRIITILYQAIDVNELDSKLAQIQWIDFEDADFETAYTELLHTLDTDREYVEHHTKWQQRATEWNFSIQINPKDESLLLRGSEFLMALAWLTNSLENKKTPQPTSLILKFIEESQKVIEREEVEEEKRKRELLLLQEERTNEAEKRLALERKTAKRQRIWLILLCFAFLLSIVAMTMAFIARNKAEDARRDAEHQRDIAGEKTEEAERLAKLSEETLDELKKEQGVSEKKKEETKQLEEKRKQERDQAMYREKSFEQEKFKLIKDNVKLVVDKNKIHGKVQQIETQINKEQAVSLAMYAKDTRTQSSKLSFRLAELAYRKDNNNDNAFGAYLDAYYDMFKPNLVVVKHNDRIINANFSPNGQTIVTASWDCTARISNLNGSLLATCKGHESSVNYAEFSPNGEQIITASNDKTIRIWNLQGVELKCLKVHTDAVQTASFSPDGKRIVTACSDGTSFVIDLEGRVLLKMKHPQRVGCSRYSYDGQKIISCCDDKSVRIWELNGSVRIFNRYREAVNSVTFSPNGRYVLTSSNDRIVRLYDLSTNLIKEFPKFDRNVMSVGFSKDGKNIIASIYDNGLVYLLPLDINVLSNTFNQKTNNWQMTEDVKKKFRIN